MPVPETKAILDAFKEVATHLVDFSSLDKQVAVLSEKLCSNEREHQEFNKRFDGVDTTLGEMHKDISEIKLTVAKGFGDITTLIQQKDSKFPNMVLVFSAISLVFMIVSWFAGHFFF